jgi:chromosome segregation ATPase
MQNTNIKKQKKIKNLYFHIHKKNKMEFKQEVASKTDTFPADDADTLPADVVKLRDPATEYRAEVALLKVDINQLKTERDELREENKHLSAERVELEAKVAKLKVEITRLVSEVDKLRTASAEAEPSDRLQA